MDRRELIIRCVAGALALAFIAFTIAQLDGLIHRPCELSQTCEAQLSK
jgi:hypothetical protein